MDKSINFAIEQNNIIIILVNTKQHFIGLDDRKINAKSIYDLLDYQLGDTYSYEEISASGKEKIMLEKLQELFKSITDEISKLNILDKDTEMKENIRIIEK